MILSSTTGKTKIEITQAMLEEWNRHLDPKNHQIIEIGNQTLTAQEEISCPKKRRKMLRQHQEPFLKLLTISKMPEYKFPTM